MYDKSTVFPALRLVPEAGMGTAELRRPGQGQGVILEFAGHIITAGVFVFRAPVRICRKS